MLTGQPERDFAFPGTRTIYQCHLQNASDTRMKTDIVVESHRQGYLVGAALIGPEAEEGGYVAYPVEFGVVFYIEEFHIAADGSGDYGMGDVFEFAGSLSADGTVGNHVGVEMAAVFALDGAGAESFSHQQGLHFTEFERAK